MRHTRSLLFAFGLVGLCASISAAAIGCGVDCHTTLTCGEPPQSAGDAGGGGSGGADAGAGACVPSEAEGPVDASCGVFIRLEGSDENSGSKGSPVATFEKALSLAMEPGKPVRPVYACAETFKEAVVAPEGAVIYGGLDCAAGWSYVGASKRTSIAPPAGGVPLKLIPGSAGTTRLIDLIARAADAEPGGGSSIAVIASAVTASIEHCDFIAGNGSDGEAGATPTASVEPTDPADPSIAGSKGTVACMGGSAGNIGGLEKKNPVCQASVGGAGGNGKDEMGEKGADGLPLPNPNPLMFGVGGNGAASGVACTSGVNGNGGAKGSPGEGATELGSVDLSGYAGAAGEPGLAGAPGQGGGGGGGAAGKKNPACYGASGGGGGAGGCGGGGGLGGAAGGSSIALVSLGASLSFKAVNLTAGSGGAGGVGGAGQAGGVGGNGGAGGGAVAGTFPGCAGGRGGNGGQGGQGGGGRGGHSVGVAFVGAEPSEEGVTITLGMAGKGGAGGAQVGSGADGEAAGTIAFK